MKRLGAAIFCDYAEENWPSMQLVADMLLDHLGAHDVQSTRIQPASLRYFRSRNADRLLNRLVSYPLVARRCGAFDIFHVIDHSYAHLVHVLPANRTIVTCHDADTFRCVVDPSKEPRPLWFRAIARYILSGLQKAAHVVCVSETTRAQLVRYNLVEPARMSVVYNGVHPAFTAEEHGPRMESRTQLLHVGSTIPRKRIDLLLRIFAECRKQDHTLHLVRVGPPFTPGQNRLAVQLGVQQHITHAGEKIASTTLADLYRRTAIVLLPSEAEGFGLPLIEAMSCGTPVVASHIPALCEIGGDAVVTYPVGDITRWSEGLLCLLEERAQRPENWYQRTILCRRQASLFTWERNARELARLYRTLLTQN